MPPSSEIVERNIAALSGGPEEWRQRKAEHAEKRSSGASMTSAWLRLGLGLELG